MTELDLGPSVAPGKEAPRETERSMLDRLNARYGKTYRNGTHEGRQYVRAEHVQSSAGFSYGSTRIADYLAIDLFVAGILVAIPMALVICIIVGGLLLGIMNTVLTEAVMEATDLPRSVASSAYSAVRFIGGAVAPPLAAFLSHLFNDTVPYLFAGASVLIAALVVLFGRKALAHIDTGSHDAAEDAEAIVIGDAA